MGTKFSLHTVICFELSVVIKHYFYAPAWKVRRGHLVIGSSVRLSVCLSVIPSRLQSAIIKVWVMIQPPNLDCKFIYGSSHFTDISCILGGGVKM